jgi:hypothetical protein
VSPVDDGVSRADARGPAEALYTTGHWLLRRGQTREAAAVARALVRVAAGDERGWLLLAVCHESAEQPELALEMYGVGRSVASPAPRCELARARLLRGLGRYDESADAYELAAQAAARAGDDDLERLIDGERKRP